MATQDADTQKMMQRIAPDAKEPSIERFLEFCVDEVDLHRKTAISGRQI